MIIPRGDLRSLLRSVTPFASSTENDTDPFIMIRPYGSMVEAVATDRRAAIRVLVPLPNQVPFQEFVIDYRTAKTLLKELPAARRKDRDLVSFNIEEEKYTGTMNVDHGGITPFGAYTRNQNQFNWDVLYRVAEMIEERGRQWEKLQAKESVVFSSRHLGWISTAAAEWGEDVVDFSFWKDSEYGFPRPATFLINDLVGGLIMPRMGTGR